MQIVYPEGDSKEISRALSINQIVDINGFPLQFPLQSTKIIAYEVYKITTRNTRNEEIREFHLKLVPPVELEENRTGRAFF